MDSSSACPPVPRSRAVVVWEWCNSRGQWRAYNVAVSQLLERALAKGLRSVYLGDAEPRLANFKVNLVTMKQLCDSSECVISVCRRFYGTETAPGRGAVWQWGHTEEPSHTLSGATCRSQWHSHDMRVQCVLERAWEHGERTVDLCCVFDDTDFIVNFCNMTQVMASSGAVRDMRRQRMAPYPLVKIDSTDSVYEPPTLDQLEQLISLKQQHKQRRHQHKSSGASCGSKSRLLQRLSRLSTKLVDRDDTSPTTLSGTAASSPASPAAPTDCATAPTGRLRLLMNRGKCDARRDQNGAESCCSSPRTRRSHNATQLDGTRLPRAVRSTDSRPDSRRLSVATVSTYISLAGSDNSVCLMSHESTDDTAPATPEETLQRLLLSHTATVAPPAGSTANCCVCGDRLTTAVGDEQQEEGEDEGGGGSVLQLLTCQHLAHLHCLCQSAFRDTYIECGCCGLVYGVKRGDQPPGRMSTRLLPIPLPGYAVNTIEISYTISPGIQGREHPCPGQPLIVNTFPLVTYLPNTGEGRQLLSLLEEAWRRRLLFTVAPSPSHSPAYDPRHPLSFSPPPAGTVVVANSVEHKTELHPHAHPHTHPHPHTTATSTSTSTSSSSSSSPSTHGYPDASYFARVTQQLARLGVT